MRDATLEHAGETLTRANMKHGAVIAYHAQIPLRRLFPVQLSNSSLVTITVYNTACRPTKAERTTFVHKVRRLV
jgi:hypothetical protein